VGALSWVLMDERDDADPAVEPDVEHEPTISYIPPGEVPVGADPSERLRGAFWYALVVERGPRAGMAYVLAPGITTVGRDTQSDIFLDDVTVSRYHARVTVEDDTLTVEDVGSTNGTYVNSERTDGVRLKPGDEVIIGKYHLIVARGDA